MINNSAPLKIYYRNDNWKGAKINGVNGMPNRIHLLAALKPSMQISDLERDIKNNSSNNGKVIECIKNQKRIIRKHI